MFSPGRNRSPKSAKGGRFYRTLLVLGLSIALLAKTFPRSLILADYFLNTEEYAAFCINKEKPELKCNGTCQMEEKVKNMEQDQEHSRPTVENLLVVYTVPEISDMNIRKISSLRELIFPLYKQSLPQGSRDLFLHPPQHLS